MQNLNFAEFEEDVHDSCLAPENVDDLASKMKERVGFVYSIRLI